MADISEAAPIHTILPADKHAKDKQKKHDQPSHDEEAEAHQPAWKQARPYTAMSSTR